jgi:hypothetical protein
MWSASERDHVHDNNAQLARLRVESQQRLALLHHLDAAHRSFGVRSYDLVRVPGAVAPASPHGGVCLRVVRDQEDAFLNTGAAAAVSRFG